MENPDRTTSAIVGVGVDVVDIVRFGRLVSTSERFTRRWFTALEWTQCSGSRRPEVAYASRFAVKEAVWKSLGVEGWHGPIAWRSIEVIAAWGTSDLAVTLHGRAADEARRAGAGSMYATVSVVRGVATAFVTATRAAATPRPPRPAR